MENDCSAEDALRTFGSGTIEPCVIDQGVIESCAIESGIIESSVIASRPLEQNACTNNKKNSNSERENIMAYKVDLNSDLGESYGAYKMGCDDKIIPIVTSANVACGFHASDPVVMAKTIRMAAEAGIAVGAHPGYPDLMGFGRRNMVVSPEEAKSYVLYQIGALDAFCRANGMRLQHVKPHGALYNMAGKDYNLAHAICEAVAEYDRELVVLALSGSELVRAAEDMGLRVASEVFADRAYEEDGSLVNRRKPGAMIEDEDLAVARVVRMIKEGRVESITGKDIDIRADSICVHGDGPKALAFAARIRETLTAEGIEITALK